MLRLTKLAWIGVALLCGGCSSAGSPWACRAGERPAVVDTLYFGTAMSDGAVSDRQWRDFIDRVVTPRFPQGLSAWQASGQWRRANGAIEREASHVLQVVHPDSSADDQAVREVADRYAADFKQDAVLRTRVVSCMSLPPGRS